MGHVGVRGKFGEAWLGILGMPGDGRGNLGKPG